MQYPNTSEYLSAIRNSSDNLDKLSSLVPVLDNQGEPYRSVGGFAVVFKMKDKDTGRLYAIKCFHEEQARRSDSYIEIGKVLGNNKSSYLLDVSYLEKELFVDTKLSDEKEFPVLKMDWVEGETMETYIVSHYRDTDAIKQLYLKFCDLALWLRAKSFAHGDIKPDNIMIKSDGNLTLVDYDGMYVPALKGNESPTIGTKNFSHPLRTSQHFDEHIDDFSLSSISISLLAMSEDPSLFEEYGSVERLLFSEEDYLDLKNSKIYKKLYSKGGLYPKLLNLFRQCLLTYEGNQSLYDQIFDLQTKAPEILFFANQAGDSIYLNDKVDLRWRVTNATQLTINGNDVSEEDCFVESPSKTKYYELKVSNGLKEAHSRIRVIVLPQPKIVFHSNKTLLRKGKEHNVQINWDIQNGKSANLRYSDNNVKINLRGEKVLRVDTSSEFKINVVGLDGVRTFSKSLRINVFSESETSFIADKVYSMPGIPIKLSWNVKHAKDIELLKFGKVDAVGERIVSPKETTTYSLRVTDVFETKEHLLKIQMLPLPSVSLKVPIPQFVSNTVINVNTSKPPTIPAFPDVRIDGIELKAQPIPDLNDLGIKVELSSLGKRRSKLLRELISYVSELKNKINKIMHYE